ncbi:serine/threonine-protein kinase [Neorhodopirellula pilleata]|uniref:Serine/threonine-protein kinase PknH n=1 Tax=Neorhodopirellula pilleata TaxID=2714738 RepID=A0A5C6AFS3_9BACT|nr:serine/threonine-protein kinase [Neorhodopirellula pilleata]TWT98824.1 Serine/threonine-protein kinase PknH [Neorhodopirellula pilleata]
MIALPSTECPSDRDFQDFLCGRLPDDRFGSLLEHLDTCDSCQDRVPTVQNDTDKVIAVLAQHPQLEIDPFLVEADCQAALYHAATRTSKSLDRVLPPIENLGPYRLIRPLGHGGMGAVYLAEHQRLRRQCAIKLLPKERGLDSDWRQRFEREMQAIASLTHPNIVAATDGGEADGWHFLVMEYLDGLDLSAVGRRLGSLDIQTASTIMRDVCLALSALHDAGLVHRDIKPSNVMLTRDGQVKLLDLGLVLDDQLMENLRLTTVGHVLGTLAFAAPEQLSNRAVIDARADLYGVGATLFQLIAGRPAHPCDQGIGPLVIEKTSAAAPSIQSVVADVPSGLADLVAELLQRNADDRPSSASEVARRLEPFTSKVSLRSLARRALRIHDNSDESIGSVATIAPSVHHSHQFAGDLPPVPSSWRRWLMLGGFPAALAVIIIFIDSRGNQTRIETRDGGEPTVTIDQSTGAVTNTAGALMAEASGDEEQYKGKTFSYWCGLMKVERDTATLKDGMQAISILAEPQDVDAAHAILIAARRFGGWVSGSDTPSGKFMSEFLDPFGSLMPQPGIAAITRELSIANDRSVAACLWTLQHFRGGYQSQTNLAEWAGEPANRDAAIRLHDALQSIPDSLLDGDMKDLYRTQRRYSSLVIALTLDLPLDQETGLEDFLRDFHQQHLNQPTPDPTERLRAVLESQRASTYEFDPNREPKLEPLELIAAIQLKIEFAPEIFTLTLLNSGLWFGDRSLPGAEVRLTEWKRQFERNSQAVADQTVLWLVNQNSKPSQVASGQQSILRQLVLDEPLWIISLPSIARETTQPQVLEDLLESVPPPSNDPNPNYPLGPDNWSVASNPSQELSKVIEQTIAILDKRHGAERADLGGISSGSDLDSSVRAGQDE